MFWLGLLLFIQSAVAGPFTAKTMRQDWPVERIEREFTLPKGWFQVGLQVNHKMTSQYRDADGRLKTYPEPVRWNYSEFQLTVEHGFSDRTRLYLVLPLIHAHLRTADDGHIRTTGIGDANAGLWFQPWRWQRGSVAFQANLKTPSGVEWTQDAGFLTGTGLTNLSLTAHGRMKWVPIWSSTLSIGYTLKFPAIVGYVLEEDGFGNGRLDAGDAFDVRLTQTLQFGPRLSADVRTAFSYRGATYVGAAGPGISWYDPYYLYDPAYFMDVGGALYFEPVKWIDVHLDIGYQVLGTTTLPFSTLGLEEFSPQPGVTLGLGADIRW